MIDLQHSQKLPVSLGLASVIAMSLSGCLGPSGDELPLTPLSTVVPWEPVPVVWTWPPPMRHDAEGGVLPPPPDADARRIVQQLVPGRGAEPNIGVTADGSLLVTAFDKVMRSPDSGATWHEVYDYTTPGAPRTQDLQQGADPMLWVDPITDRAYVAPLWPALVCTHLAWSDHAGEPGSWFDRPAGCLLPQVDHQKLMTAPPGPAGTLGRMGTLAHPTVVYLCMNKIDLGTWCAVSRDGGLSFAYETMVAAKEAGCAAINGHPAAYPDGTVALALGSLGSQCERPLTVGVSEDDGLTWQLRTCDPARGQTEIDADITITPDGTAYLLFRDRDQRAYLARSVDKFRSCDVFPAAPPKHSMHVFTAVTSGDDGRIAMAYLGTKEPQPPETTPSQAMLGTHWHLFVTTSMDAHSDAPTFTTWQVTPDEDPVQVGCVWLGGGTGGPHQCRNLLDFIDMARDHEGRFYVAFTDGCVPRNECAGSPFQSDFQSRESQVAVAVQVGGPSLLASRGLLAPLALQHPDPYVPLPPGGSTSS